MLACTLWGAKRPNLKPYITFGDLEEPGKYYCATEAGCVHDQPTDERYRANNVDVFDSR